MNFCPASGTEPMSVNGPKRQRGAFGGDADVETGIRRRRLAPQLPRPKPKSGPGAGAEADDVAWVR